MLLMPRYAPLSQVKCLVVTCRLVTWRTQNPSSVRSSRTGGTGSDHTARTGPELRKQGEIKERNGSAAGRPTPGWARSPASGSTSVRRSPAPARPPTGKPTRRSATCCRRRTSNDPHHAPRTRAKRWTSGCECPTNDGQHRRRLPRVHRALHQTRAPRATRQQDHRPDPGSAQIHAAASNGPQQTGPGCAGRKRLASCRAR